MGVEILVQERLCVIELAGPSQSLDLSKVRSWRERAPSGQRGDSTNAEHRRRHDQDPVAKPYSHR